MATRRHLPLFTEDDYTETHSKHMLFNDGRNPGIDYLLIIILILISREGRIVQHKQQQIDGIWTHIADTIFKTENFLFSIFYVRRAGSSVRWWKKSIVNSSTHSHLHRQCVFDGSSFRHSPLANNWHVWVSIGELRCVTIKIKFSYSFLLVFVPLMTLWFCADANRFIFKRNVLGKPTNDAIPHRW